MKRWADMTETERRALPPARRRTLYQRDYYERTRKDRNKARRERRKSDMRFRDKSNKQQRQRRAKHRAEAAPDKLKAEVAEKFGIRGGKHRRPRYVTLGAERILVYTTGALARAIGRECATVRAWISEGVLPGCSVVIGGRCWFSERFARAVYDAIRFVMERDARTPRAMLRRVIRAKLREANVMWV